MSDWTRSTSDLAACWRRTGAQSRTFMLRERLSDCANRADHEIRLILHDPVGAHIRQHMTASWQTSRHGDVLCASLCWCGHCGQDNHGLVTKIRLPGYLRGRPGKVF